MLFKMEIVKMRGTQYLQGFLAFVDNVDNVDINNKG